MFNIVLSTDCLLWRKVFFFKPRLDELFLQTSDSNFAVNKELGILATITRSIHARLLLDVKDAEILHNVNSVGITVAI